MKATIGKGHPNFGFIPWELLRLERFQRPRDEARILAYVRDYDPDQVNTPIVAELEDGEYSVLDGQHTIEVEKQANAEATGIYCRIVRGKDYPARAAMFLKLNAKRKAVAPLDRILAGDQAADPIDRAVLAALTESPYKMGEIKAYSRLKALATGTAYRTYGLKRIVLDTLRVLHEAYGTEGQGHFFDLYYPIANVLSRYKVRPSSFGQRLSDAYPHPYLFRVAVANRLAAYPTINGAARKEIITEMLSESVGLMPQAATIAAD